MGGFAAATYLRGIRLAHVPTTLLAQVDAAVGGKVGVNLPGRQEPRRRVLPAVGSSSSTRTLLATLHRREFRAGLYEVIKYGVACDGELFDQVRQDLGPLSKRDVAALTPVIADCCRIKGAIVAADEREAGARRVLNFGHTVGHALEAATRYRRLLHGEAVAYGMLAAVRHRGDARRRSPAADRDTIAALIAQLGPLPPVNDLSAAAQLDLMRRDKKVDEGRLHFVLPTGIGSAPIVTDVSEPRTAPGAAATSAWPSRRVSAASPAGCWPGGPLPRCPRSSCSSASWSFFMRSSSASACWRPRSGPAGTGRPAR